MIQKIYEVDPLRCPKCNGAMRILAFIEDQEVIRKILSHLGLWKRTPRAPPLPPRPDIALNTSLPQVPAWEEDLNQAPGFPIDGSASHGKGFSPGQGVRVSKKASRCPPSRPQTDSRPSFSTCQARFRYERFL